MAQEHKRLPTGMVIGPDGKPCKICTAFRNWRPPKQQSSSSSSNSNNKKKAVDASFFAIASTMNALAKGSDDSSSNVNSTSAVSALLAPLRPDEPPQGCPPDVEQLGCATWTFLHTTAAYYPDQPTQIQRRRMLGLLFALPVLYPCSWCAMHFDEDMRRSAPDVTNRAALSRWLCERHNEVNVQLGKPTFDCSLKNLDERWKDGPSDGRCD